MRVKWSFSSQSSQFKSYKHLIPLISSSSCLTKSSPYLTLLLQHQQHWLHGDQSSSSPSLSGDIYNIKHLVNRGGRGSE
ncbi:hypothetical protein Hanom_Chr00s000003g01604501 [Helianthus anomalus]